MAKLYPSDVTIRVPGKIRGVDMWIPMCDSVKDLSKYAGVNICGKTREVCVHTTCEGLSTVAAAVQTTIADIRRNPRKEIYHLDRVALVDQLYDMNVQDLPPKYKMLEEMTNAELLRLKRRHLPRKKAK